jgi:RNA polymerase sigma factor (TIGR02999 family)
MGSVTSLLNQGTLAAALADTELQTLLYQELKIIARSKIRKQATGRTNTTALVHEAFIKLSSTTTNRNWTNRHHFFSTAAITMRHILVDQARAHLTEKRGSGIVDMEWQDGVYQLSQECQELVALNEALQQLEQVDAGAADLVNLKYFVGLSMSEVAEIMGVPLRTVERQWQKAKVILKMWLSQN